MRARLLPRLADPGISRIHPGRVSIESFSVVSLRAADKLKAASAEDKRMALRIYEVKVQVWEKGHSPRFRLTWLGGFGSGVSLASQYWDFEGGSKPWWYPYGR